MARASPDYVPPVPTEARLHEAALRHLARFGTTRAGLIRVLDRRVMRWARATEADADAQVAPRAAVRTVVDRLVAAGAVDDAAFAATRAAALSRGGRSQRAISIHLATRGVSRETSAAVLETAPDALAVAVAATRRRRIGPYRTTEPTPETARRELGVLARAGFSRAIAEAALALDRDAAEMLLAGLRAR